MLGNVSKDLNITPGYGDGLVVVHASQYDVGRTINFNLTLNNNDTPTIPTGTTATVWGTKPDGHGFDASATLNGYLVSFDLTQQMTAVAGKVRCEIRLINGSNNIGTGNFILDVERAGLDSETIISDTTLPLIISQATEQMETAEAWAVGTRGGVDVPSTDPTYHNNAKYWAEQAQGGGGTISLTSIDLKDYLDTNFIKKDTSSLIVYKYGRMCMIAGYLNLKGYSFNANQNYYPALWTPPSGYVPKYPTYFSTTAMIRGKTDIWNIYVDPQGYDYTLGMQTSGAVSISTGAYMYFTLPYFTES